VTGWGEGPCGISKTYPKWIKENADILAGPIVLYDYGEDIKPYVKPMYEFMALILLLKIPF